MAITWITTKDEQELIEALRAVHWVVKAFSLAEFRTASTCQSWDMDVIVLELSDGSLLDLCREICSKRVVPLLVLVPNLAYAQAALETGADHFVVAPIDPIEILLRARKLVRAASFVQVCDLEIDLSAWRVAFGGCPIHLSPVEFRLLACLAKRMGQTVSYAEVMEEVWGWETEDRAQPQVKNAINRVRQKIELDLQNPQYIITISKHGYRLRNHRQWKARAHGTERLNVPLYDEYRTGLEGKKMEPIGAGLLDGSIQTNVPPLKD